MATIYREGTTQQHRDQDFKVAMGWDGLDKLISTTQKRNQYLVLIASFKSLKTTTKDLEKGKRK